MALIYRNILYFPIYLPSAKQNLIFILVQQRIHLRHYNSDSLNHTPELYACLRSPESNIMDVLTTIMITIDNMF